MPIVKLYPNFGLKENFSHFVGKNIFLKKKSSIKNQPGNCAKNDFV